LTGLVVETLFTDKTGYDRSSRPKFMSNWPG